MLIEISITLSEQACENTDSKIVYFIISYINIRISVYSARIREL